MVSFKRFLTDYTFLKYAFILTIMYFSFSVTAKTQPENFVPFNSFNVDLGSSTQESPRSWSDTQDTFVKLIKAVNNTEYHEPYFGVTAVTTFENILNKVNLGKYKVLSVGHNTPYILYDVLIQNIGTFSIKKFSLVKLTANKREITSVEISEDPLFISSLFVRPTDQLQPDSQFRIKNSLNLFAPFDTSDNENERYDNDFILLQNDIQNIPSEER